MSLVKGFLAGIIKHDLVPECINIKTVATLLRENMYAEIAEQPPAREALAIADTLSQLGLNIQFLGSEEYVLNKLQTLKANEVTRIREAFIQNNTPRFMKYFFTHKPSFE